MSMLIEVPTAISTFEQDNLIAAKSTSSPFPFLKKLANKKKSGGGPGSVKKL